MSPELNQILRLAIYLPLYVTAFVGVGLVLKLRRTHPRACWYSVAAFAALAFNWGLLIAVNLSMETLLDWSRQGRAELWVLFMAIEAASASLQTTAAGLLIAAVLTGRRAEP